ncbi:MAG: KEOPS complex subunit Pcc1 [Candidatus Altiarchaeota archaeon]|nr:KEOPS complex subunit Pcc1 [Candidatus Altiarchaeota archaeon]
MNELRIRLGVPTEIAEICCRSVEIEAKSEALHRSNIDLEYGRDYLSLNINASDLGAMRAALNTYLRWIIMCCDLLRTRKFLDSTIPSCTIKKNGSTNT